MEGEKEYNPGDIFYNGVGVKVVNWSFGKGELIFLELVLVLILINWVVALIMNGSLRDALEVTLILAFSYGLFFIVKTILDEK